MLPARYLIVEEIKFSVKILKISEKSEKIKSFTKIILSVVATVCLLPLTFLSHIVLSLINLVKPVRLGMLNRKGRISIMISYIEPFVRDLRLKQPNSKPLIIVINPGKNPNEQITKMYKKKIWLLDGDNLFFRLFFKIQFLFFSARSKIGVHLKSGITEEFVDAWNKGKPIIKFTKIEEINGKNFLQKLGIPENKEYICMGLRDENYYKSLLKTKKSRIINFEAESNTYLRNPPLENYLPLMSECAKKGLYVIYMGQFSEKRIPKNSNKKIIDYSPELRTPFNDVYLLANCKFVIAGGAPGLWWISTAFNKPVVLTDCYSFSGLGIKERDLFIPVKWWSEKQKKLLPFRETIEKHLYYSYEDNCKKDSVKIIFNNSKEKNAIITEMLQKLNNTWKKDKKDEDLQKMFKSLFKPKNPRYKMPGKIGAEFLKENIELLK